MDVGECYVMRVDAYWREKNGAVPRVETHLICFRRQYSVALEARTNKARRDFYR
jgi:hypothetical protein